MLDCANDWRPLLDALAETAKEGRTAHFWLRDDDAVAASRALSRFKGLCLENAVPVLLAVIPHHLQACLSAEVETWEGATIATHGFAHVNHATVLEKKSEYPAHRASYLVQVELRSGRQILFDQFGARLLPIFVPPWNRVSGATLAMLPDAGYTAWSGFGRCRPSDLELMPLRAVNTHVDIIDWHGGRKGRPISDLARELADHISYGYDRGNDIVIGILTHHLDHDDTANAFLSAMFGIVGRHSHATWLSAEKVFQY
ncbi:MAG: polysaccharide deacetylase family protein [Hyphomicrobiaceae bacterium]